MSCPCGLKGLNALASALLHHIYICRHLADMVCDFKPCYVLAVIECTVFQWWYTLIAVQMRVYSKRPDSSPVQVWGARQRCGWA